MKAHIAHTQTQMGIYRIGGTGIVHCVDALAIVSVPATSIHVHTPTCVRTMLCTHTPESLPSWNINLVLLGDDFLVGDAFLFHQYHLSSSSH